MLHFCIPTMTVLLLEYPFPCFLLGVSKWHQLTSAAQQALCNPSLPIACPFPLPNPEQTHLLQLDSPQPSPLLLLNSTQTNFPKEKLAYLANALGIESYKLIKADILTPAQGFDCKFPLQRSRGNWKSDKCLQIDLCFHNARSV